MREIATQRRFITGQIAIKGHATLNPAGRAVEIQTLVEGIYHIRYAERK
ncbi:hypothetical protein [Methanoculleus sp.]|nr:hypothetical protein [Methanoculleus sp.]